MSSCISTKLFAKSVEVAGWRLGWVGVGEGWSGDGGAVVMIQDGAKLFTGMWVFVTGVAC